MATSLGSEGEVRTSKRSSTAVETLLTFCPPGPAARMNRSLTSSSEMLMVGVTSITGFSDSLFALSLAHARCGNPLCT